MPKLPVVLRLVVEVADGGAWDMVAIKDSLDDYAKQLGSREAIQLAVDELNQMPITGTIEVGSIIG